MVPSGWWELLVQCGGLLAKGGTTKLLLAGALLLRTHRQYLAFRVACSERVSCVNACRMGSSKSPIVMKSCSRSSAEFLAGFTFRSGDSMCTCIYCVFCIVSFMYIYSCFVCTSVSTIATE